MRKSPRFSPLLLLLLLAPSTVLLGQGSQVGNLQGQVNDESGGVLPGVGVTATSQERGFSRTGVSDASGRFLFAAVPIGRYRIVTTLPGFETVTVTDNLVESEKTTGVIVTMRLAGQAAEVTVTGEIPIVDKTNTSVQTRLRQDEFQKLPIGRSYQGLFNSAPGVTGAAGTGAAGNPNVHGSVDGHNLYLFDGVDITDPTTGTFAGNLNFEAIQEVSIVTAGMSAEYGRGSGGVVNVITKSGTNTFEGSVKYIVTNDDWDAQNKTSNQVTGDSLERVKFDNVNETWSYTLGGPVWKDHVWFFGAYENAETISPQRQTVVVPENFQETLESPFWNVRLTAQPASNHQVWGKYHESPTNGFMIDYYANSRVPVFAAELEAMTRQDQGSDSWAANWSGVFGSKLTAEALYAETDEFIGVFPFQISPLTGGAPHQDLSSELYYNGSTFVGTVQRPREQALLAATYYADLGGNSHGFKIGFDWQHLESTAQFGYTNNQFFYDDSFDPSTRTFEPNTREDYDAPVASTSEGDIYALFLRDKFEVGDRLFFELGARLEKQESNSDIGQTTLDATTIAPRFAASYDVLGSGKTLVVGTYGRFYQFVAQSFSDAFAQNVQQGSYNNYVWDGTQFVFEGRVELSGSAVIRNPDINPEYHDEVTLGFQQQVGNAIGLGIRGIYRKWNDMLDDVITFDANGDTATRVENYSVAERDYIGLELTFEKRFSQNWNAGASYTYSRVEGNHFSRTLSTLGDYIDATCRTTADPSVGSSGFIPCSEVQDGRNKNGLASYDRPHNFKAAGAYTQPIGPVNVVLGLAGQWISGVNYQPQRAMDVLRPGTSSRVAGATYFYGERGSERLDPVWTVDTSLELTFRLFNLVELGGKGEVFNVFDEQEQIQVNNLTFCGNTVNPSAGCTTARNNFGTATARGSFQSPRTFRLTALVRF